MTEIIRFSDFVPKKQAREDKSPSSVGCDPQFSEEPKTSLSKLEDLYREELREVRKIRDNLRRRGAIVDVSAKYFFLGLKTDNPNIRDSVRDVLIQVFGITIGMSYISNWNIHFKAKKASEALDSENNPSKIIKFGPRDKKTNN